MKNIKRIAFGVFVVSFFLYIVIKSTTYSINVENYHLEADLNELTTSNDELQIQLATNLSRTELMEKYPDLELYDNIYYIESEEE